MASSGSTDAQSWVFPPPGVDIPPIAATGDFGPVHFGDSMILDWDASTSPDIVLTCFSQLQNSSSFWAVRGQRPPAKYTFVETAIQQSAADLTFCHFFFDPSAHGNTIVFQYDNKPQAKAVTWSAGSVTSSTTSSKTSSATTAAATATSSSATNLPSTTNTSISPASPIDVVNSSSAGSSSTGSGSGGLSAGTSAGIGVGVALGVLLLAGIAAFFLWRRRKAKRAAPAGSDGPFEAPGGMQQYDGTSTTYNSPQPSQVHSPGVYQDSYMAYKPMPAAELHGAYQPSELPGPQRPVELQ